MADTKISAATLTTPQTTDLIPLARGGSSVARHATVAAIVQAQAASTTAVGSVELATAAETQAGTSSTLAVTPAGLAAAGYPVYNATSYGAVGGSDSTAAIQAAMDAAGAAGGGIVVVEPSASAYLLTTAGTHTGIANHKYCLKFNYDNTWLEIQPGATLKLADAQQADGAPVDVIIGTDRTNIRIYGGGTITGNTAGQTGWSGGYGQITSGCLILFWGTSGNGNSKITIENLTMSDHFSNPVEIQAAAVYDNSYIYLRNLVCTALGEGPSVSYANHVWLENIYMDDTANVTVGDGIQSEKNKNVIVCGAQVFTNGGGGAIELAGSQQVTVSDFIIDGWASGISIQGVNTIDCKDVTITNGLILNCAAYGIQIDEQADDDVERITIDNVVIRGCTTAGIYTGVYNIPITGPLTLKNVEITGCGAGFVSAAAIKNLSILGGIYSSNTTDGIAYLYGYGSPAAADTVGLRIDGVVCRNNGTYGIEFVNAGTSGVDPTGSVVNCDCTGNGTAGFTLSPGLTVGGMIPNYITSFSDATSIAGYEYFSPRLSSISTFLYPSSGQILIIRFDVDTWHVLDKSQAGGNNIRLVGGVNFVPAVGNRLCLEYDEVASEWVELWRRIN